MLRGFILASLLLLAGAFFFPPVAFAYSSPGSPNGYVSDFARVLSPDTVPSLNSELETFEASTSNEIAVVTVPNMGGDYIENYAVELFKEWGIGQEDTDNGVLILLSIEERKIRIEVGYGLEGVLPDSLAQRIIDNEMVPSLKAGNYDTAASNAVRAVMQATQGEYKGSENESGTGWGDVWLLLLIPLFVLQWLAAILARSKSWWAGGILGGVAGLGLWLILGLSLLFGISILAALLLFGLAFDFVVSRAYGASKSSGQIPPWWSGGSGGGFGGGSSSGSSGGFGGGSSGGGGASGGW